MHLGEPLTDRIQLDGQPAKEQCELSALVAHAHLLRAIVSMIEIIEFQGKSCLA